MTARLHGTIRTTRAPDRGLSVYRIATPVYALVAVILATLALVSSPAYAASGVIVQGPINIDNTAIAQQGVKEFNNDPGPRPTGFNMPGECVKSVERWLM